MLFNEFLSEPFQQKTKNKSLEVVLVMSPLKQPQGLFGICKNKVKNVIVEKLLFCNKQPLQTHSKR